MVAADGAAAWGAIALGQAVGTVGVTLVNYGWGLSGPAAISMATATARTRVYKDSVRVRLFLFLPVAVAAGIAASVIVPSNPLFAAAGSISTTATGLTGSWYFIGVARPYAFLVLETVPRAGGTVLAILLMKLGFNAIVGLVCITGGMFLAFVLVTYWVYLSNRRAGAIQTPGSPLRELLRSQRSGLFSMVIVNIYAAAPIAIYSIVEPATQPVFALANKIQLQLVVGLSPVVDVMQSWVPRAVGRSRLKRAEIAVGSVLAFSSIAAVVFVAIGEKLFAWLGRGEIEFTNTVVLLVALTIIVNLLDGTFRRAILPTYGKLNVVMRATFVSALIGLPMVGLGARYAGVDGALGGAIVGICIRIAIEAFGYVRVRQEFVEGVKN